MSADDHPKSKKSPPPSADDGTHGMPVDPRKTWVPDDRGTKSLSDTKDVPTPPDETEAGSLDGLSQAESGPSQNADEPPRQFGDYELLEVIGRGGMGNVYKARHRSLDRIVALKILKKTGAERVERQIERFVREAKAAGRLDHPNIVTCYEFGELQGWHYLTMAFVEGESLHLRLAKGPIEPAGAARIVHALAGAVAHAHSQGVIHRDIKPANVLLGEDGRPRLTDFGIAKLIDTSAVPINPTQLTQVGQALGTPGYMAPEQSAGRRWEVGPSVDIYGLGGVLSAALTGRPGHSDTVASLTRECPDELHRICERCLAYRPVDRYQSAEELAEDLDKYLNGSSLSPAASESEEKSLTIKVPEFSIRISPRSLLKFGGFAFAVLLCSFLIAGWWTGWLKDSGPPPATAINPDTNPQPTSENRPIDRRPGGGDPANAPIRCRFEVLVDAGMADFLNLDNPNTLPLEAGDEVLIDVKVDRREGASLYLVRVGTPGKAELINDAQPIPLSPAAREQLPIPMDGPAGRSFRIQAEAKTYLPVDRTGPAGMITLVLLSRKSNLSDEELADLNQSLAALPTRPQSAPRDDTLQRYLYRHGSPTPKSDLSENPRRNPLAVDHPVVKTLGELMIALDPYSESMEAVSFAVPEQIPAPARAEKAKPE